MTATAETRQMLPCARWKDDCQGKKNYDGPLLSISCRYYPTAKEQAEGSHWNYISGNGELEAHLYEADGKASAIASIILEDGPLDENDTPSGYRTWRESEFVGDSCAEVKTLVEQWVQQQFDEIRTLLGLL